MTVIPPITDPMGKFWEQPPLKDILVDDTHAVMTTSTLLQLKDYSQSNPSGVYPGKMWRGKQMSINYRSSPATFYHTGRWELHWYGISEKGDKYCSNNSREILLID